MYIGHKISFLSLNACSVRKFLYIYNINDAITNNTNLFYPTYFYPPISTEKQLCYDLKDEGQQSLCLQTTVATFQQLSAGRMTQKILQ